MRAAASGQVNLINKLVVAGADTEHTDRNGRRALEIALLHGNTQAARILGNNRIVVVPGYVSPMVRSFVKSLATLFGIALHFFDVISDILLAVEYARDGRVGYTRHQLA